MFKNSSQSLKVALSVLFIVALAALGFFVLKGGPTGEEIATTPPGSENTVAPSTATTQSITMEEAQKQFKAIQDQVQAGTLSPEEAKKQMDAIGPKILPPPLPAEAKVKK